MPKDIIEHYKKHLDYIEKCNRHHIFNYYDSEYVETVKKHIETMEIKENYDDIPVVACKYCDSVHIIEDEQSNDVCMKCGSINEIRIYNTIYDVPGHSQFKK